MSRVSKRTLLNTGRSALTGFNQAIATDKIEPLLQELVKIRASQINGCAFCLSTHTEAAFRLGERADRLSTLPAWREVAWFTDREKGALAWTEALTLTAEGAATSEAYAAAREVFEKDELVDLTFTIISINSWNRMNVAFGIQPPKFELPTQD